VFAEAAMMGNWQMQLLTQPAQSPDTNILDLSFFRALQSAQWDHGFANEIDSLITHVIGAYNEISPQKIDFGFLTLHSYLDQILMEAISAPSPHWGRRNFLDELALFHFVFLQVLLLSVLQGRYSVLNAMMMTAKSSVFRVSS
jgi:hypothetical protein